MLGPWDEICRSRRSAITKLLSAFRSTYSTCVIYHQFYAQTLNATKKPRLGVPMLCFSGALASIGLLSSILPVEPAYIGFFVLIPLTIISAIAVIQAVVLTFMIGRQEPLLIALLVATLAIIALMVADASDKPLFGLEGKSISILSGIYGLFTLGTTANWFLVRRKTLQGED